MRQRAIAVKVLAIVLAQGCGGITEGPSSSAEAGGGGTAAGSGTSGSGSGGTGSGGRVGAGGFVLTGGTVGEDASDPSCDPLVLAPGGILVIEPEPQPILYFMIDRSLGMADSWDSVAQSMERFVRARDSAHLEVALQYFPLAGGACDGEGYATPEVPLGPLPDRGSTIIASLANQAIGGAPGDAFEGALRGAMSFCAGAEREDSGQCAVVLVTASAPSGCDPNADLVQVVAATEGVPVYAIGLPGADRGGLDTLSEASGVDCSPSTPAFACDVGGVDRVGIDAGVVDAGAADAGAPDADRSDAGAAGIDQALAIARRAVSLIITRDPPRTLTCEYEIPPRPEGKEFDPDLVNVVITYPTGETELLEYVPSSSDCAGSGWHYDDRTNPRTIVLCPESCARAEEAVGARAELHFGCQTARAEGP